MTKKRYTRYEHEEPPKRRWKRIVLWSSVALVLAILLTAAGSYIWFRTEVSSANHRVPPDVRAALQEKPSTSLTTQTTAGTGTTVQYVEPSPSAMNLLVIGSDRRTDQPSTGGRSDTIMIVHVDPDRNYLSVLSLPRDLRVDIPGHGKGKINTAFAYGGAALAIRTVEQTTGVDINHYLEIGFDAFSSMVDSLGGVYVDVDKRYYNPDYNYEPINLYPGYQLLKGADALDYVRYRHDTNLDFGRMERQQRFMTAVREQAMGWDLPFKLPGLISALFQNVTTDLDANQILRLARWGVGLNGDGIRGITLKASTGDIGGASYVLADENQIAGAVDQLLYKEALAGTPGGTGSDTAPSASDAGSTTSTTQARSSDPATTTTVDSADLTGVTVDVVGDGDRPGLAVGAGEWLRSMHATLGTAADNGAKPQEKSIVQYPNGKLDQAKMVAAALGLEQTTRTGTVDRVRVVLGRDFVLPVAFGGPPTATDVPDSATWKKWAAQSPYTVMAPGYLPTRYAWVRRFPDTYPSYNIDPGGSGRPAFRMMYASPDSADQVMGITETTWLSAPIASKGLEVTHDGVVYTVVRNDTKVECVWFKANGVLYFVSNTLSHWLSQDEMLKIAESMIVIPAS